MDSYRPIYDAVRSRISGCDVGSAVESVMRAENIGHYFAMAAEGIRQSFSEYERPSVVYRPTLTKDGDSWIALYGENLQEGVTGCGETPEKAMRAFDEAWRGK